MSEVSGRGSEGRFTSLAALTNDKADMHITEASRKWKYWS